MDYQEYLKSDTWKTIRAQRIAIDNGECVLCAEPAEHVHHRRYPKELGSETVNDLVCLCAKCHAKHHESEPEFQKVSVGRLTLFVDENDFIIYLEGKKHSTSSAQVEIALDLLDYVYHNTVARYIEKDIEKFGGKTDA